MSSVKAYDLIEVCFRHPRQAALANDRVSLTLLAGEVFALLGPNGAGKTTLVRQMMRLLEPTRGEIWLFDQPLSRVPDAASRRVAYMPQSGEALNHLHVAEILYYTAHLRGLSPGDARRERDRLIDALDLGAVRSRPVMALSGGQRRLALLATALAARREVMILDEPTNDLDPQKRRLIWDLLREERTQHGTTMVLVTHNILEAEPIIDRLAILYGGRVLTVGRVGELKAPLRHQLKLEIRHAPGQTPRFADGGRLLLSDAGRSEWLIGQADAARAVEQIAQQPQIEDFVLRTPTLEDLYLTLLDGA